MDLELAAHHDASTTSVRERLLFLRSETDRVCRSLGREPGSVRVLAVTKRQPRAAVLAAIDAGLEDVGENYLQEARAKYEGLPAVRKHFIGHIQTNKAKAIAETFDVVQSVDRLDAGRALARAARTIGKPLAVLVQVNISPAERFGAMPSEAPQLAADLRALDLNVDGVMAIGPITADRDEIRRAFALAAATFERVGGATLSLGMSDDWELALAAGSTMIRLGTRLFGPRSIPA